MLAWRFGEPHTKKKNCTQSKKKQYSKVVEKKKWQNLNLKLNSLFFGFCLRIEADFSLKVSVVRMNDVQLAERAVIGN